MALNDVVEDYLSRYCAIQCNYIVNIRFDPSEYIVRSIACHLEHFV